MIDGTTDRWHVPMERKIDWRQEAIKKIHTATMCLDDALEAIRQDKSKSIDRSRVEAYLQDEATQFELILNYHNKLRDLEKEMRG